MIPVAVRRMLSIGERAQLLDIPESSSKLAGRSRRSSRHYQVDSRVSVTRSAEDFVTRPMSYCIDPRAEKKAIPTRFCFEIRH